MKIINQSKNNVIASQVKQADTFFSRFIGLLNRSSLNPDEALIITRCQSIHMFFMRFAIDAVFVDKNNRVVGLVKRIKSFQLSPVFFTSSFVVELPSGAIDQKKIALQDQIVII